MFIRVREFLRKKFHLRELCKQSIKRWQTNMEEDSCLLKRVCTDFHSKCPGRFYLSSREQNFFQCFLWKRIETKVKGSPGHYKALFLLLTFRSWYLFSVFPASPPVSSQPMTCNKTGFVGKCTNSSFFFQETCIQLVDIYQAWPMSPRLIVWSPPWIVLMSPIKYLFS